MYPPIGTKVLVYFSPDRFTLRIIGEGVLKNIAQCKSENQPCPIIQLDNGQQVRGCRYGWGPVETAEEHFSRAYPFAKREQFPLPLPEYMVVQPAPGQDDEVEDAVIKTFLPPGATLQ
jgi:hypothetical protein